MSEHTDGPWYVLGEDEGQPGVPCVEVAKGRIPSAEYREICLVSSVPSLSYEWRLDKQSWANAHLIAAAPDLLEALDKALRWLPDGTDARCSAIQALAKARNTNDEVET